MRGVVWTSRGAGADEQNLSIFTHGFHYGTVVFDGLRFYSRKLLHLRNHLTRFFESMEAMHMPSPVERRVIEEQCEAAATTAPFPDGYLRPMAFRGSETIGIGADNPVVLALLRWEKPRESVMQEKAVCMAPWGHGDNWLPKVKVSGKYLRSVTVRQQVRQQGFDDAVFADAEGNLCESTGANLFVVCGDTIYTPPLSSPILAGVTRTIVIKLCQQLSISIAEEPLTPQLVSTATEMFLTNTAESIVSVAQFEDMPLDSSTSKKLWLSYQALAAGEQQ